MQKETLFKNKVRPMLKKLPYTWACKIQQVAISGTPDFLMCIRGHFVALELKKDGEAPISKLQSHELGRIQKAKGYSFVAYPENWDRIYAILLKLSAGENVDETEICHAA